MGSLEAGQGSDADRMREQGRKAHSVRAVEHRCDWLLSVHKFVLLCFYWATVDGWMDGFNETRAGSWGVPQVGQG